MDSHGHASNNPVHYDFGNLDDNANLGNEEPNEVRLESTLGESSTSQSTRLRDRTAICWKFFEKNEEISKACCKICRKQYNHKKRDGTSTLTRHLEGKHKTEYENSLRQQQIQTCGNILSGNFSYNHNKTRSEMARFVVTTNVPLGMGECQPFMRLVNGSFTPAYKRIPRSTLRRDIFNAYKDMKNVLIASLDSRDGFFSLTCDSWKGCKEEYFLCVTCHWIDVDWNIQKRILGFKIFEFPHNASNIARLIISTCRDYRILDKILCISFDNARNNDASIPILQNNMHPILDGQLFHNRCACHILNLCVKDGYASIESLVTTIRHVILFIKTSPIRGQHFKALCLEQGLNYKRFRLDCETRWNSTFDMLQSVLPYQNQLIEFCNNNGFEIELTNQHFDDAFVVSSFLKTFKEATVLLSGSYYPTTHHMIPTLVNVAHIFKLYQEHSTFGDMMKKMLRKFKKYYDEIPILYCIALCLDPRAKASGFESSIDYYYDLLDNNYDSENQMLSSTRELIKSRTSSTLTSMFNEYEKFSSSNASASAHTSSSAGTSRDVGFNPRSLFKRQRQTSSRSTLNELSIYEISPPVEDESADFDILKWWHEHEKTFPILSRMAMDILAVPVSTVASESAFSESGRRLDERRSRLSPCTLEILMCTSDWWKAEDRQQGLILQALEDDLEAEEEDELDVEQE